MNDKDFYLYIDETGLPNPKTTAPYILCGCSVLKEKRDLLKTRADQIKFKYWGRTNINLHSVEISKEIGDFSIFKENKKEKENFIKDLFYFLNEAPIFINCIIIDKEKANLKGWIQQDKLVYETAENLIRNFILMTYAKGNVKGRIVVESSSDKDQHYLKAFLSNGIKNTQLTHSNVKNCMTSISFVTKQNEDIETQITDLLSYGAKCKFNSEINKKKYTSTSYEGRILKIFEKKLFKMASGISQPKKVLLDRVESFQILP